MSETRTPVADVNCPRCGDQKVTRWQSVVHIDIDNGDHYFMWRCPTCSAPHRTSLAGRKHFGAPA